VKPVPGESKEGQRAGIPLSCRIHSIMEKSFLFVDVTNPTWLAYVAFLVVAVYFRFSRILTIRNLDLTLLLLLSTAIVVTGVFRNAPVEKPAPDFPTSSEQVPLPPGLSAAIPTQVSSVPDLSSERVDAKDDADGDLTAQTLPRSGLDVPTGFQPADAGKAQHPVYKWASLSLMGLTLLLIVRLIFDESFTRRPRLDQNLNQAGITFLCIPAFAILMISVLTKSPVDSTFKAVEHGRALLERRDVKVDPQTGGNEQPAPTETLIAAGGAAMAQLSGNLPKSQAENPETTLNVTAWLARIFVVVAHTLVVLGLLSIARQHFASLQIGISMSCLYLLLPCTAVNVHELNHVLPAACLIWAIASYRNPVVSGILLGLASGTLFFAAFLLPLWAVFYGRKGGLRFVVSVLGVTAVLITSLLMISGDASSFTNKLVTTANWTVYRLLDDSPTASDASLSQLFIRIPMAAAFFVMLTAMTVLPRPRNLENLLANSTCLVVAAQMWYPDDIGTYVLWYLPLFLVVIFRPRLDRFTPPESVEREAAVVTPPVPAPLTPAAGMSPLSFLQRNRSTGH